MGNTMLTSEDWNYLIFGDERVILDPDGWDRRNWEHSWKVELVSAAEFRRRFNQSTVQHRMDDHRVDDMVKKYGGEL